MSYADVQQTGYTGKRKMTYSRYVKMMKPENGTDVQQTGYIWKRKMTYSRYVKMMKPEDGTPKTGDSTKNRHVHNRTERF